MLLPNRCILNMEWSFYNILRKVYKLSKKWESYIFEDSSWQFSIMLTYLEMRMLRIETVAVHITSASISSTITLMKIRPSSSIVVTTPWGWHLTLTSVICRGVRIVVAQPGLFGQSFLALHHFSCNQFVNVKMIQKLQPFRSPLISWKWISQILSTTSSLSNVTKPNPLWRLVTLS